MNPKVEPSGEILEAGEPQLETVLEQLERLDDGEDDRRKNADARLTSVIAIMPVVVALATSGIFPLIQNIDALGGWRFAVIPLYLIAIVCFLAGIFWAVRAFWPTRGNYKQSTIGSISKYRKPGTSRRGLLLEMIDNQREMLKHNQRVNGRKLGEYMRSVTISGIGLVSVTLAVIAIATGILLGQIYPRTNAVRATSVDSVTKAVTTPQTVKKNITRQRVPGHS